MKRSLAAAALLFALGVMPLAGAGCGAVADTEAVQPVAGISQTATTGAGADTSQTVATATRTDQSKPAPPDGGQGAGGQPGDPAAGGAGAAYTIEQAISDRAQENTIAFDALGFWTGTVESDSFFPPGKVADFWGFQYLRDNDSTEMGHNTDFLTSASLNMLTVLTTDQRAALIKLATAQVPDIQEYGYKRFVLMQAFRRLLEGDLPQGTTGLNEDAVAAYSAELYQLDGQISYERAQVMGPMLAALTGEQEAYLDAMKTEGMSSWPAVSEVAELQGLSRDVKEAVMTYAGDMYSWWAGDIEADTYFCPERQGTYFGSFYLKDAPAVGNPGYSIGTTVTNDLGTKLLGTLSADQAQQITGLVDSQRPFLTQIVDTRRAIATELRKYQAGETASAETVAALMKTYGELDGQIIYNFAATFAKVGQSLTAEQKAALDQLRADLLGDLSTAGTAYLFSTPVAMPDIPDTDFLFTGESSGNGAAAASGAAAPTTSEETATAVSSASASSASYAAFTLTSAAVVDGQLLPQYACEKKVDGVEPSIPLAWKNVPAGATSLAVVMYHYPDPNDLTKMNSYLLLWGIDRSVAGIPFGEADDGPWFMGANKDGVAISYTSPCSKGAGVHEYHITIYALSETPPSLPKQSSLAVNYAVFMQAIKSVKIVGSATLDFTAVSSGALASSGPLSDQRGLVAQPGQGTTFVHSPE
jgi:phosphatidylethanolamine-binding protein (PEBP) family uncharacterized protein